MRATDERKHFSVAVSPRINTLVGWLNGDAIVKLLQRGRNNVLTERATERWAAKEERGRGLVTTRTSKRKLE